MFFKQLYTTHKYWFYFVCIFVLAQLFIFYKRGVTFAPFYNFGMYSEPILPKSEYQVFEVWVNGNMLNFNNYSPKKAEKILAPLYQYSASDCNAVFYRNVIVRLMPKVGIHPIQQHFLPSQTEAEFLKGYKQHLQQTLGEPIAVVEVKNALYQWRENHLQFHSYLPLKNASCR